MNIIFTYKSSMQKFDDYKIVLHVHSAVINILFIWHLYTNEIQIALTQQLLGFLLCGQFWTNRKEEIMSFLSTIIYYHYSIQIFILCNNFTVVNIELGQTDLILTHFYVCSSVVHVIKCNCQEHAVVCFNLYKHINIHGPKNSTFQINSYEIRSTISTLYNACLYASCSNSLCS